MLNLRTSHTVLFISAILLPAVIAVVLGFARLLGGMGDQSGALVLDRIGLACGIVWTIMLVALVLLNALRWELNSDVPKNPEDEITDLE